MASDDPVYLTPEEKERLEAKLSALISNRPEISRRIAEAKDLGDLKENAEYHAAREQQGWDEAEITRIQRRLDTAHIISGDTRAEGVVFLGSIVKLREIGTTGDELYRLVGEYSDEAPTDYEEVTVTSPMGQALMKASVGETISVRAPRGVKQFLIVAVE